MTDPDDGAALESLLEYLRETHSLDFTGYERPSLTRRIRARIDAVGAVGFDEYRDLLEADPDEQSRLVDTILINLTGFSRDTTAWEYVSAHVVPAILATARPGDPIRVWSAGCASGEEAHTLAMVFADQLGAEEFQSRVKIFATDTDDAALVQARRGVYSHHELESVPSRQREQYFDASPDGLVFRAEYRRQVIFGRNDLTTDAPISHLDLLVCRNVLMYLSSDTQRRVLSRFGYAVKPSGYLFLGKAETISARADLFEPVSSSLRVFRRSAATTGRRSLAALADRMGPPNALHDLALAATPIAQLVLDVDGRLSGANAKARAMFGLSTDDINRPFWDLDVARRPVDLRPHLEQAYAEARPVELHEVSRQLADGRSQVLEVSIAPLSTATGVDVGASITFADVTELGRLRADLAESSNNLEIATAHLVSLNEFLETMNEELQSTNQELATTNEELQSTNRELATMNDELLEQTNQIESARRFHDAVLDSLPLAMAVTDRAFDVVVWNHAAHDMFGVRSDEATGRSFMALDIGLPFDEISALMHRLASEHVSEDSADSSPVVLVDAIDRHGRPFVCRVRVSRVASSQGEPTIMILMERTAADVEGRGERS